jgi:DnaD and phage-associated domain
MCAPNLSVAVPREFIEKYMSHANPYFVKVYLYALSLKQEDDIVSVNIKDFADSLNMLATDIDLAIRHWQSVHIIDVLESIKKPLGYKIKFVLTTEKAETEEVKSPIVQDFKSPLSKDVKPESESLGQQLNNSKELKTMLLLSQNILGKPLSPSDTKTLFSLYDWLNLPVDVILMLLEYCASIDNTKMSFIEKTAITWHELGLNNMRTAQDYLNELGKRDAYISQIKDILEIQKPLTTNEKKHIALWQDTFHSSIEMVALALEYCIAQIGKMSVPYISAILKSWYEQGTTSIEEAKRGNDTYKTKTAMVTNSSPSKAYKDYRVFQNGDYDYDEISKLAAKKLKNFTKKGNG